MNDYSFVCFFRKNMDKLFFTREQLQIMDIQMLYKDRGVCNIGGRICERQVIDSHLPVKAMQQAVNDIASYHIRIDTNNTPYLSDEHIVISKWDGDEVPTNAELREWMSSPFNLYNNPLCELRYWANDDYVSIYMKVHHIIVDGYSFVLTLKRYIDYYQGFLDGKEIELEKDYGYIECMRHEEHNSERENRWFKQVVPNQMPDNWKIRKTNFGNIGVGHRTFYITGDFYDKVSSYLIQTNVSFESLFYTMLGIYASKTTGSNKVCFGRSMINRRKKDMNMAGIRVNQMPVFFDISEKLSFAMQCKRVNSILFEMMRYSSASFMEFLREEKIANTFFDTAVSYRNDKLLPSGKGVEQDEIYNNNQELPIRYYINDMDNSIRIDIQYQTELFSNEEVENIYKRLLIILEQGMEESFVSDISILTETDEIAWNNLNSERAFEIPDKILLDCISDYANQTDKIAVVYNTQEVCNKISYPEMLSMADNVANYLYSKNVKKGNFVSVRMEVSELLPIVFLGIWKAGAAFIPIAMSESEQRIGRIREICPIIITNEIAKEAVLYNIAKESAQDKDNNKRLSGISPEMTAYGMYTSGTTGESKLVMISHGSLAHRVKWMLDKYGECGTVMQKAAYTFDVSMWEFFLPLVSGEILYLLPDKERSNPASIANALAKGAVQTVHFVPSMLGPFLSYVERNSIKLTKLRHVYSSGEALPFALVKQFYKIFESAKLHNLYGPTECTIDVTYYDCNGTKDPVPIGRPLPGTTIEVLDDSNRLLPVGVEGNLVIGGILVGKGYYGYDSGNYYYDESSDTRKYITGDQAMLGYDGMVYYRGRLDQQCKVNGMRVDLQQIENAILDIKDIVRAAVVMSNNQLIAFYMANNEVTDIDKKIANDLPYYSIPTKFILIENIPLTENGKTDYKYLQEYLKMNDNKRAVKLPKNDEEKVMLLCIEHALGEVLSVDENIFYAGLDSIKLMEVIIELEENGFSYSPEEFYEHKTIEKIVTCRKYKVQWLCKKNSSKIVIAFPYAAGTADAYKELAKEFAKVDIDFCVTHSTYIDYLVDKYDETVLLGYCTGTSLAMKTYENIKNKKRVLGIVLCAAIPPKRSKCPAKSPWSKLGDNGIVRVIHYLHREKIEVSEEMIKIFRKDSDLFFDYFNQQHLLSAKKVILMFGDRDILTYGCKRRWKIWREYLRGPVRRIIFRNEYHFFLDSKKKEIAEAIRRLFDKER